MTDPHREELIEKVGGAYRDLTPGGELRHHPAWHDLDDDGRRQAHERAVLSRQLESALDPEGLSTTAKAGLALIQGQR